MHVDFSFYLIFNEATWFLFNRIDLFIDHKLLPVHLTWLHLVYGNQMKPCQVDWQKLVIYEKIYSVEEKSSCFMLIHICAYFLKTFSSKGLVSI